MRIRIPAPTLLSRVTPDVDKDWKGYAISNIANVSIQTDGVIVNDLLLKRYNASLLFLRDVGDNTYQNLKLYNLNSTHHVILNSFGGALRSQAADNAYALIKAYKNTVGLAEIARLQSAATPTFDILAGRLTGDLDANDYYVKNVRLPVGDMRVASAATQVNVDGQATYVRVKAILTGVGGMYRVEFGMVSDGTNLTYGQIYKNGAAYGTEQSQTSSSWISYSEDLDFNAGDTIELYAKSDAPAGNTAAIMNFYVNIGEGHNWNVVVD